MLRVSDSKLSSSIHCLFYRNRPAPNRVPCYQFNVSHHTAVMLKLRLRVEKSHSHIAVIVTFSSNHYAHIAPLCSMVRTRSTLTSCFVGLPTDELFLLTADDTLVGVLTRFVGKLDPSLLATPFRLRLALILLYMWHWDRAGHVSVQCGHRQSEGFC